MTERRRIRTLLDHVGLAGQVGAVILTMLTLTLGAQVKDRAEVQLQAAIKLQLVEGDLKGAITQFKKLSEDSNPEVAALALLHLADCYDTLGQAEARPTYEKVVRQYPNQTKVVADARTWLDAHGAGERSAPNLREERLWTGDGARTPSRPSADGRYVAFVDSKAGYGNVAVRDLLTGENHLLTRDASSNAWTNGPVMSLDGKRIAYRWVGGKDDSIRVISSDGTQRKTLARRPEYGDFLSAWSPDGTSIAAVHYNSSTDGTKQIILISTNDGSIKTLKSLGWQQEPTVGGFSPDGRFLVYSQRPDGGRETVFAIAVDGGGEIALVQNSANNRSPVWSHDGTHVVFLSDRSGSASLWSIAVQDGRPVGEPTLVKGNVGSMNPLGFTKDGSFHYSKLNLWRDAYVADIDATTLAMSKPTLVADRLVGANFSPALSPDGSYVAFFRNVPDPDAGHSLMVRSMKDGVERVVGPVPGLIPVFNSLLWFPDNRSVLLLARVARPLSDQLEFRVIDIETGATRSSFDAPRGIFNTAALSPDGRTLYYTYMAPNESSGGGPADLKSVRLMKRRLDTGNEVELYHAMSTGVACFGLTVSSDGTTLAFQLTVPEPGNSGRTQTGRSIFVMPVDGGVPHEIYRTTIDNISSEGAMIWTKDQRHLIVSAKCGAAEVELCAIPADGGTLRSLGFGMLATKTRMLSSDGRRLFFTGEARNPELWVVRNLLSAQAKAR